MLADCLIQQNGDCFTPLFVVEVAIQVVIAESIEARDKELQMVQGMPTWAISGKLPQEACPRLAIFTRVDILRGKESARGSWFRLRGG
jgi:hypothetical protein